MLSEVLRILPTGLVAVLVVATIIAAFAIIFGIIFLIKFLISKMDGGEVGAGPLKVRFGKEKDGSIGIGDKKGKEDEVVSFSETLAAVIANVVSYSVDNAYKTSTMRQNLYNSQLKNTQTKFNMIKTLIIGDYSKLFPSSNLPLLGIILDYVINLAIISNLEKIYQSDRLAEKPLDDLLTLHKNFIDGAFVNLRFELIKLIGISSELIDQKILDCVDKQKTNIQESIVECFDYAHREAVNYTKDIKEINSEYSSYINTALMSYFSKSSLQDYSPEIWNGKVPPGEIKR